MSITVLVKVVPDVDSVVVDPETRTLRREGAPSFVNPFDLRAVLVALALRRPGERVTVLTMGPPAVAAPLREALALGVDEGIVVSDPALAGSDTLVTARVLSRALRLLECDLVLTGRHSVDASTGQVPAQVAELLGLPFVDGARSLHRSGKRTLEIVTGTETGRRTARLTLPGIVAVGEKAIKVRHPTPEELEAASSRPLTFWDRKKVGLHAAEVGQAGSPTVVTGLIDDEPARHPTMVTEGSVSERVARALEALSLSPPADLSVRSAPPAEDRSEEDEVLVWVSGEMGGVDPNAASMAGAVAQLGEGLWPSAVGFGRLAAGDLEQLGKLGTRRFYRSEAERALPDPETAVGLAEEALRLRPHAAGFLFLSSAWPRQLASRLSARLGFGLVGDAVAIAQGPTGRLTTRKPSFGGGKLAEVDCRERPLLATLHAGSLTDRPMPGTGAPPEVVPLSTHPADPRVAYDPEIPEVETRFGDLQRARIVVGVGMGIGSPDRIPELLELLRPVGAALGATRKVVDAGWLPGQLQIGLTGQFLAPEIYVAVGTSGKPSHLVGVKRARRIVGINVDPAAPLWAHVDVGLVGRWENLLGPLLEGLARSAKATPSGTPPPRARSR